MNHFVVIDGDSGEHSGAARNQAVPAGDVLNEGWSTKKVFRFAAKPFQCQGEVSCL